MIERLVLKSLALAQSFRYDVEGVRNDVLSVVSCVFFILTLVVFAPLVLG